MIQWRAVPHPDDASLWAGAATPPGDSEIPLEYSPEVERYFRELVNLGSAESLAPHQIQGEAGSVERGTWIIIQVRVEAGQLEAVRFLAYGCPHTIAACCRTTEKLAGAPVGELLNFAPGGVAAAPLQHTVRQCRRGRRGKSDIRLA